MLDKSTIEVIAELNLRTDFHPSFFEKDWYTTKVLNALTQVRDPRFQLVFSGGTSLSKGYQLIERFSEDIDFKVIETQPGLTRTDRREFRRKIAEVLNSCDPDLTLSNTERFTRKEGTSFFSGEITYKPHFDLQSSMREFIQLELNFRPPTLDPSIRQLTSIVNKFTNEIPEVDGFRCVSLAETAADKIGALSWRVVGIEPDRSGYDPRLIRHLYDLHYLAPQIADDPQWLKLTLDTVKQDISRSTNREDYQDLTLQFDTPHQLLQQLVIKLGENKLYQQHYQNFVEDFTYGKPLLFDTAIESLSGLVDRLSNFQASIYSESEIANLSDIDEESESNDLGLAQ
jgi:predicted nucleotidyltransferase component of viral defense system